MFACRETVLKKVVTIIATVILDLQEGNAIKVSHYQEKNNFQLCYEVEASVCSINGMSLKRKPSMMLICLFYPCLKKERGVIETNVSHFLEKLNCLRGYGILKCTYVSKNSNKMAGNLKIKA